MLTIKDREKFLIAAGGTVETVIGPDPYTSKISVRFHCVSCENKIAWNGSNKLFECAGCGYDMTASEAGELYEVHVNELKKAASAVSVKRGIKWRLLRWLRRK